MHYEKIYKFIQYSSPVFFKSNLSNTVKFTCRKMSTDIRSMEKSKSVLKNMYFAGVNAVSPQILVKNKVNFKDGILFIGDQSFELKENVYLVGFGKAVMGMAIVLEHILGKYLKKGIVSVPSASMNVLWESEDKSYFPLLETGVVKYYEGSENNQPDDRSLETTHEIIDLVESLTENDILIVLISGGGSALLYMPRPVIDCEDKLHVCKMLQAAGADIKELNIIRSKLSMVKGGGLARMAYPASIIGLILSDIVGDPIELIASGPTVYSDKKPKEVIAILKKYNLFEYVEGDVKKVLISKERFKDKQLLIRRKKQFKHVTNIILGNNTVAIEAASLEANHHKLTPIILRSDVVGDVHDVSLAYAHITSLICLALDKTLEKEEFFEKVKDIPILSLSAAKVDEIFNLIDNVSEEGLVLIGGGEPTVVVKGNGKGGRNQELALHFSLDWLAKIKSYPRFSEYEIIMLSAGTDGQDGPTDAAGAFGYPAIGPLIHDVYTKVKSLASRVIIQVKEKEEAIKKKEKEQEQFNIQQQQHKEICKRQELSGFLTSKELEMSKEEVDINKDETDKGHVDTVLPFILQMMEVEHMLPENTLKENNTYNLYSRFKKGSDLFKTGFTGTNVMDLHFIYIKKRKCDCKIDFGKEIFENTLDMHDLHIDPSTIERYKSSFEREHFDWDTFLPRLSLMIDEKVDQLNIKIIDDNLTDPCCRKERKFPLKNLLKGKDLPL
ncbi:PREDICTED: glycerate kinase [Eufriesea mexicana]|uniref:glycerate kinase n=1 Tax=Eufriesea mexicana TaxID=516756 RepID=UPI00083C570D|nr:PREDICTED: glycerate kinase [Eufriesea mexicana]